MAITVTNLLKFPISPPGEFISIIKVTGDTSYPNTGGTVGYPITAATFSLNAFASTSDFGVYAGNSGPLTANAYFLLSDLAVSAGGTNSQPDSVTGNLRMFGANGTELANTVTAVGNSCILMAIGH